MDFWLIFLVTLLIVLLAGGAVLGTVAFLRQERQLRAIADMKAELARLRVRLEARPEASGSRPNGGPAPLAATAQAQRPPDAAGAAKPPPDQTPALPPPPASGDAAAAARGLLRWLEELAGGRLSVLLGGLALALGGVFLVRYSIDQGLLGPAGRIGLGALFAGALAAAGEYLRRGDLRRDARPSGNAYIPGALTAAAIITALATIYAAHALYGFIGPVTAFVLLGLCSFAALSVSSIHGPALAALGLVGSFATPLLVGSTSPDPWMLFSYLLIVTLACFFTAHLRRWLWLAVAASLAADAWGVVWLVLSAADRQPWAVAVYVAALAAGTVLLLHRDVNGAVPTRMDAGPDLTGLGLSELDRPVSGLLAGHGVLAMLLAVAEQLSPPSIWALIAVSLLLGWAAWTWRNLALAPAIAAAAVLVSYVGSRNLLGPLSWSPSLADQTAAPAGLAGFLWTGAVFGVGFGCAGLAAFLSRRSNAVWPCVSAAMPLLILVYCAWISTRLQHSMPFAVLAALLAVAFAAIAEIADRRPRSALMDWGVTIYAAAAVAALALALALVLEKGWLTIALALMAPGLALIERQRPIGILRWLVAGLAAVVVLRLLTEPSIVGGDPGSVPIFNWLLYAYGIPAIAFWYGARLLLRAGDDLPVKFVEGAAIAFLAGLIGAEIRHLMTGGAMGGWPASLGEYGLHAMSWIGLSIGLKLRAGSHGDRLVPRHGALGFGGLGLASLLVNNLLLFNPVVTGNPVGAGLLLNDLLLAYGLPSLLCGGLYAVMRGASPRWAATVPAGASLILAFAYVTFEVARWFEGPVLAMTSLHDGELYAYSVAWLLFALVLLAAGIGYGSAVLRQSAFGVMLLVTLKVFLIDLAGLTGLLQAGSFIGLGLALIGIGLAYQRLVLRSPEKT